MVEQRTSTDLEMHTIGAGIRNPGRALACGLVEDDFGDKALGQRWAAVVELARLAENKDNPLDPILVSERAGCPLGDVFAHLDRVSTGENLGWYARAIKEHRVERQAREAAESYLSKPGSGLEGLSGLRHQLGEIELPEERSGTTCQTGILAAIKSIEDAVGCDGVRPDRVATHIDKLDTVLGGLKRGSITVVGGRPSAGKSSLMAALARSCAVKTVYCSLEDSQRSFFGRLLSQEARVNGESMALGTLRPDEWTRVTDAATRLYNLPIVVNDSIPRSHHRLLSWIERTTLTEGCDLLVIDYFQLIRVAGRSKAGRNEQLTEVSNDLSALVRSLDVACILGSQLNREAERERPSLGHLRDCGALEADADCVVLLDDFRWKGGRPRDSCGMDLPVTAARVAKNKHGRTGTVLLKWEPQYTLFSAATPDLEMEYRKWMDGERTKKRSWS